MVMDCSLLSVSPSGTKIEVLREVSLPVGDGPTDIPIGTQSSVPWSF